MPAQIFGAAPAPVPWCTPWATGRFYGWTYGTFAGFVNTNTWGNNNFRAVPIYVPNPAGITAVNVGIEITTIATAGTLMRLGIYNLDANSEPSGLLVDGGTCAGDATGYQSVTINKFLRQGWYFIGGIHNSAVTSPTFRAWSGQNLEQAGVGGPAETSLLAPEAVCASVIAADSVAWVAAGLPGYFPRSPTPGGTYSWPGGTLKPRFMIGT